MTPTPEMIARNAFCDFEEAVSSVAAWTDADRIEAIDRLRERLDYMEAELDA